jgi:hypothetical protein
MERKRWVEAEAVSRALWEVVLTSMQPGEAAL